MLLLLLLSATTVLALASNPDDDINLEHQNSVLPNFYQGLDKRLELCQDNAKNTRFIKENIERITQDSNANAKRAEVNIEQILQNDNANFKRSEINIQQVIENANAHAKRIEESLDENTRVLKQILQALGRMGAVRNGTSCHTTTTTLEELPTTLPTSTVRIQAQGRDCAELYSKGERENGIYLITLVHTQESFQVYCDMKTDGGGWTVFQRRGDFGFPADYFYRNWTEYKNGFGELDKEFWLGNDLISALSHQRPSRMRVDLWDMEQEHRYVEYGVFKVEKESSNYILHIDGMGGTTVDSLSGPDEYPFSTKDRNNDRRNCAVIHQGAWWYYQCHSSNLNGLNLRGPDKTQKGIHWRNWKGLEYSLASTEMKMRMNGF